MSDLIARLRKGWHGMAVITLGGYGARPIVRHLEICLEAADRIEELEEALQYFIDWDHDVDDVALKALTPPPEKNNE